MNVNEVKDYLRQIRREQIEINHLKELIENEWFTLLPKGITYDKDRVQVSMEDLLAKSAAEIEDIRSEMGKSIIMLYRKKVKAEAYIRQLEKTDEREVIRWYYLSTNEKDELLVWDDVSEKMHREKRQIFRIHGNALKNLTKIM